MRPVPSPSASPRASAWEVFFVFLRLGTTSFGGPIAHLGYFRAEFVQRRRWVDDRDYADLVGLCQFLPGPASSQVGFALGLLRAGFWGALAAFGAFTLPSAVLMVAFAFGAPLLGGALGPGILSGLKIVAVAIVAQAVWGMARTLTPDARRAGIGVVALTCALLLPGSLGQLTAIGVGVVGGWMLCRGLTETDDTPVSRFPVAPAIGIACAVALALGLIALPALAAATGNETLRLFDAFFRSGSLVFGGGHVVLPLLQAAVVDTGWVGDAAFLSGYGAAQALPGPLFAFAAYLGAIAGVGPGGVAGALVALAGIFLPGFLVLGAVLPFWQAVRRHPWAQAGMSGAGAAVVGILAAALYSPVFATAVTGPASFCLAAVCFVMLTAWRMPPWAVVLVGAAAGAAIGWAGSPA